MLRAPSKRLSGDVEPAAPALRLNKSQLAMFSLPFTIDSGGCLADSWALENLLEYNKYAVLFIYLLHIVIVVVLVMRVGWD